MTLHILPTYIDERSPTHAAQRRRIDWASDELRRHDAAVARCWTRCWSVLTEAMAEAGCDNERTTAADHLHDTLADVFGDERRKLLDRLDEEGGDVSRHPCPITSLHKAAVAS